MMQHVTQERIDALIRDLDQPDAFVAQEPERAQDVERPLRYLADGRPLQYVADWGRGFH
jgi:hypothetical protein